MGLYRKHWSVTEHRTEVSPIGYQALTPVWELLGLNKFNPPVHVSACQF